MYNRVQGPYCPRPTSKLQYDQREDQKDENTMKTAAYFYSLRKYYERDSAYLGLIEAFIQDGPQLILQLYILAIRDAQQDSLNVDEKPVPVVGKTTNPPNH